MRPKKAPRKATRSTSKNNVAAAAKKIAAFAEKARLEEHGQTIRRKIWPELEKFLIAGPTFIGFALGLLNYAPGHNRFEVGFQSLCIIAGYLISLVIIQSLDSIFFSSWPIVLGIVRSVLALAYLGLTLKQYLEWRSGDVKIYSAVQKVRARFSAMIGDAG